MATTKPVLKTFTVTGTITNLQVSREVKAVDLTSAIEEGKKLKFSDFVTGVGDIYDYDGPEITSVWRD